jgi:7-cyano-7-deazaguanine synthase
MTVGILKLKEPRPDARWRQRQRSDPVKKNRAVVLVSGGLDSATTLAIAHRSGFECFSLTCVYGQRHQVEIAAARKVSQVMQVAEHRVMAIDLAAWGGSALTDRRVAVPKADDAGQPGPIPVTYVPARNTVLLSLALSWAEVLGSFDIFIGVHSCDYGGYPDCRPEFIRAFEDLSNLATAAAVEGRGRYHIQAPLLHMTKAQIIRKGLELGVDYSLTHSCYDPDDRARSCGRCSSCRLRLAAFAEAGMKDPIVYQDAGCGPSGG